jgi:hypothetical protein
MRGVLTIARIQSGVFVDVDAGVGVMVGVLEGV